MTTKFAILFAKAIIIIEQWHKKSRMCIMSSIVFLNLKLVFVAVFEERCYGKSKAEQQGVSA